VFTLPPIISPHLHLTQPPSCFKLTCKPNCGEPRAHAGAGATVFSNAYAFAVIIPSARFLDPPPSNRFVIPRAHAADLPGAAGARFSPMAPAESRAVLLACPPRTLPSPSSESHGYPSPPPFVSSCSGNGLGDEGVTALSSGLTALTCI